MDITKKSIREQRLDELRTAKIDQNVAFIEYIAMMTDIILPTESEEMTHEMGGEGTEIL